MVSDFSFAIFNMCGFINIVRRYLENKPIIETAKSSDTKESNLGNNLKEAPEKAVDPVKTKAALEFLDKEINSLSNVSKQGKESSVNSFAAKALQGFSLDSSKSE
jgi:hypothetical protein